jgi:hypothetical protein
MNQIIETDNLDDVFELLPPDIQRSLIDIAIKERIDTVAYNKKEYTLPKILQLTYFCKKCSQSFPVRIYTKDLLKNGYGKSIRCTGCNKDIHVEHKTVSLDYALIKTSGSVKNIYDYLDE